MVTVSCNLLGRTSTVDHATPFLLNVTRRIFHPCKAIQMWSGFRFTRKWHWQTSKGCVQMTRTWKLLGAACSKSRGACAPAAARPFFARETAAEHHYDASQVCDRKLEMQVIANKLCTKCFHAKKRLTFRVKKNMRMLKKKRLPVSGFLVHVAIARVPASFSAVACVLARFLPVLIGLQLSLVSFVTVLTQF